MKTYFLQIVFFLAVIFLNSNFIFACFTYGNSNPACNEFYNSRAVFIGRVKNIEPANDSNKISKQKIVLTVEENFLGAEDNEYTVYTSWLCGYYGFQIGEKYLVYVNKNSQMVSGTSKIEKFPEAEKHVEDLKEFLNKTDSNLFGNIYAYNKGNLKNIKIKVEGNGQIFETYTDNQGKYEIERLGIGNYTVTADLPLKFKNYGTDKQRSSFLIELQKGECKRLDFTGTIKNKSWFSF